MKGGDLVRYKDMQVVTNRVHEEFMGLVMEVKEYRIGTDRTIRVNWNSREEKFKTLWHSPESLEVVNAH